jgi:hypothetical protein
MRNVFILLVLISYQIFGFEELKFLKSEKYNFSFSYPSDWSIVKAEMNDILPDVSDFVSGSATLSSAKQTDDENKWNTLLFRGNRLPYFDISIHKKIPLSYQDFKNNYYKLFDIILQNKVIYQEENEEENRNGLVLYRLVYDLNYGKTIRNKLVVIYKNGYQYIFRFWSFLEEFSEFDSKFENLILSLKFDN